MVERTPTAPPRGTIGLPLIAALIALFIVTTGSVLVRSPVVWDPTTADVIAAPGVLAHWPDTRLNVNAADEIELCLLPGIGPARARAVVAERAVNGPFRSVDDLTRVHGIGSKTVQWFDEYIIVQP